MQAEQIRHVIATVLVAGTSYASEQWDDLLNEYGLMMDDVLSVYAADGGDLRNIGKLTNAIIISY